MESKKIGIVGCGVMGTVLLGALVRSGLKSIIVVDRNDKKIISLKKHFKSAVFVESSDKLSNCDVVIFSIKPQDFKLSEFVLKKKTLVVSIMAGISVVTIENKTGCSKIIRAMPNMPAKIGKGFTGWFATKEVSSSEKKFTKDILSLMGEALEVDSEDAINKITAISGSGPAYIFYMLDCFVYAAQSLGVKPADARKIAMATMRGSLAMIDENTDLAQLIKNVASKGGTTESALKEFDKAKLASIWKKAIASAYKRAKEFSK